MIKIGAKVKCIRTQRYQNHTHIPRLTLGKIYKTIKPRYDLGRTEEYIAIVDDDGDNTSLYSKRFVVVYDKLSKHLLS